LRAVSVTLWIPAHLAPPAISESQALLKTCRANHTALPGSLKTVCTYKVRDGKKKAPSCEAKCLISLVGGAGFEPATPAV
jgi:hypothetical protein